MTRQLSPVVPLSLFLALACGDSGSQLEPNAGMPGTEDPKAETPIAKPAEEVPGVPSMMMEGPGVPSAMPTGGPVNPPPISEPPVEPPPAEVEMPRPRSKVPNVPYPPEMQSKPLSETLEQVHNNQPAVLDGYLLLGGNAAHTTWDISDPSKPVKLAQMTSEFNKGEAESHMIVFAKYPGKYYAATTSGKGVDIWDVTDMTKPTHVTHIMVEGINYGDVAGGIWGKAWQGNHLYVGGNDTGLHIFDVKDPAKPKFVKKLSNDETGGFFPGPMFAMGNILIVSSPKGKGGVATMDISNPEDPILLDSLLPKPSYIGWYYAGNVFLQEPLRAYDVLSDPTNISVTFDNITTPKSEYFSFGDDQLFLGLLRPNPGVLRFDLSDIRAPVEKEKIEGRYMYMENGEQVRNDDQFSLKIGNLLVLADDEKVGGHAAGAIIMVEDVKPDSKPPYVKNVWPKEGMVVADTSAIGVSFSDQIDLATVGGPSFILREVSGMPVEGIWGHMRTVLNFTPNEPLKSGATYELVLPAGGISDLGGNPIAQEFKTTFKVQ